MSTEELQIAGRARKFKGEALTNLQQFITVPMLEECFSKLNKVSSAGIDGKLWSDYNLELSTRLPELLSEFKSGKYRAPFIRRVYILKGKTEKRPLGIPTNEDKVVNSKFKIANFSQLVFTTFSQV